MDVMWEQLMHIASTPGLSANSNPYFPIIFASLLLPTDACHIVVQPRGTDRVTVLTWTDGLFLVGAVSGRYEDDADRFTDRLITGSVLCMWLCSPWLCPRWNLLLDVAVDYRATSERKFHRGRKNNVRYDM